MLWEVITNYKFADQERLQGGSGIKLDVQSCLRLWQVQKERNDIPAKQKKNNKVTEVLRYILFW